MAASTMFYFEDDEKGVNIEMMQLLTTNAFNLDSEVRSNRVDSISSRSTLSSTGSSPTRSRENLAVPQYVDAQVCSNIEISLIVFTIYRTTVLRQHQ
jgi:hypothetical protein